LEALTICDEIGKGRFKQVHRGCLQSSALGDAAGDEDRDIVVLRYAKGKPECKTELQVLSRLLQTAGSADYVPRVWGACEQGRDLIVVQERAAFGSLKAVLLESTALAPAHGLRVALQVSRGMKCLQSARVVHADLSCRNILVSRLEEDPICTEVKVTDFGLSAILKEGADFETRKQPQATRWCSPETVDSAKLSHSADVWSLGALFWELFSGGQSPWVGWQKRSDVAAKLKALAQAMPGSKEAAFDAAEVFPAQDCYPAAAQEVLLSCLQVPEESRPTFDDLEKLFISIIEEQERALTSAPTEQEAMPGAPDLLPQWSETAALQPISSSSGEVLMNSGTVTPSTSATPTQPNMGGFSKNKKYEDKLAALLAEQEGRLSRLQQLEQLERQEQLERLEQRQRRLTVPGTPLRDLLTTLSSQGVPQEPSQAGILAGGSGVWTLQSIVRPGLMRKQEFLDKEDAWAAFVESADAAQPCHLRDPKGSARASSSWIGVDQIMRAQQAVAVPSVMPTHRFAAWMPAMTTFGYPQALQ